MERCFEDSDVDTELIVFADIATPFKLTRPKSVVDVAYNAKCLDFVSHAALRSMVTRRWYAHLNPITHTRVRSLSIGYLLIPFSDSFNDDYACFDLAVEPVYRICGRE